MRVQLNNILYPVGTFQTGITGFATVKRKPWFLANQDLSLTKISTADSLSSVSRAEQNLSTSDICRRPSWNAPGPQSKISISTIKDLALSGGGFPLSGSTAIAGALCEALKDFGKPGKLALPRESHKKVNADVERNINISNTDRPGIGISRAIYIEFPPISDSCITDIQTENKNVGGKRRIGIRDYDDFFREIKLAKEAKIKYNEIRNNNNDVQKIAKNMGIDESLVNDVKEHLFIKTHKFREGVPSRFDPDYDIAMAWERMISGKNIKESDMTLINHELMELRLMKERDMVYEDAHDETNKIYNWEKERKCK